MRLFLATLFLMLLCASITKGQSYTLTIPSPGIGSQAQGIYHVSSNHHIAFITYAHDGRSAPNRQDRLRIVEFDSCGVFDSHEIELEITFGIFDIVNISEQGENFELALEVNPLGPPRGSHQEYGLLTINKSTWSGEYQYIQGRNVTYLNNFGRINSNSYYSYGVVSYIDRQPMYSLLKIDSNFNIINQYTNFPTYVGGGGCIHVNNEFYLFGSERFVKVDNNFNPIWEKSLNIHPVVYANSPVEDGFIIAYQPYRADNLQLAKFDFSGQLIWQSPNISIIDNRFRPLKMLRKGAQMHVLNQLHATNILYSIIDLNTGDIIKQEFYGADSEEQFTLVDFVFSDKGLLIIGQGGPLQTRVIHYDFDENICGWRDTTLINPGNDLIVTDEVITNSVTEIFATNTITFEGRESPANSFFNCENVDPKNYNLLAEDSSFCEGKLMIAHVDTIIYPVQWDDGDQNKIKVLDQDKIYSYSYSVCRDTFVESIDVNLIPCPCDSYVPNAFTPNGDQINDYLEPYFNCPGLVFDQMEIFDRWGAVVFNSQNPRILWDGTQADKLSPSDTYVYSLQYRDTLFDAAYNLTGEVLLMR